MNEVTYAEDEVLCEIIKENGEYFLVDLESGERSEALTISSDKVSLGLPKNRANRKFAKPNVVDEKLEKGERYLMTYKESKHFGSVSKMPNEKLISFLSEEDQNEYKEIIARAIAAKEADKKKPMTDLEKAQAQLERAKAKLAKLIEEAAE